jgi:hypothetical protein
MNATEIGMMRHFFPALHFFAGMRGCFEIFSAVSQFYRFGCLQIRRARVQRCEMAE